MPNLLIILLFLTSPYLSAQVDTSIRLEEVTIAATRINSSTFSLPFSIVKVKSSLTFLKNDRTVPEVLSGLPGVFIQKTNHGGGSPFIRGMTGNQTLILIDGFRLNNSIFRYGPNQYLTLFDSQIVGEIEVVKGTGSVQYGSDALGGVINVNSLLPDYSETKTWLVKAISRATTSGMEQSIRPFLQYSTKNISAYVTCSYNNFGDLRGGDTTGFQRPSGYKQLSIDSRLSFKTNNNWHFYAGVTRVSQLDVPLFHRYKLESFRVAMSDPLKRGIIFLRTKKVLNFGILQQFKLDLAAQQSSENRFFQSASALNITQETDKVATHSILAELELKQKSFWKSSLTFEYNQDKVNSSRVIIQPNGILLTRRGLYPNDSRYSHGAISNTHQLNFNAWQIDMGWRYHAYNVFINDTTFGKVRITPHALVYFVGTSVIIRSKWAIFFNINTGYRAPNVDDMGTVGIVDFRYEIPAYNLKPERSFNKEVGFRYASQKFSINSSFFHTYFSNLITRIKTNDIINNYNVYVKKNVEESYIWGSETTFTVAPNKKLAFNGNVTYLFGQNVSRNEPMRRIPPMNGALVANYDLKHIQLSLQLESASWQKRLAQGDKDDNRIPKGGTPGFSLFHVCINGQFSSVKYRVLVYNILNRDFRTHGSGINGMGRTVSLTLLYSTTFTSRKK